MLSMSVMLCSVTFLKLVARTSDGRLPDIDVQAGGMIIAPLATYLPELNHLLIDGKFGVEVLHSFGLACHKLNHFTTARNITSLENNVEHCMQALPVLRKFSLVLEPMEWDDFRRMIDFTLDPPILNFNKFHLECLLTHRENGMFNAVTAKAGDAVVVEILSRHSISLIEAGN